MIEKCLACGIEKDNSIKEIYPYADDGVGVAGAGDALSGASEAPVTGFPMKFPGLAAAPACLHHPAMPRFIANADYEEKDSNPIRLEAGNEVTVGPVDRAWPGWVWAEDDDGNDGYVPEEILEPLGEGRFAAMETFDPTVLSIKRGDELESLKQIHGWHWCKSASGQEGWVAGYLLKPAA